MRFFLKKQEKKWTFSEKPNYQSLKAEAPIAIYLCVKGSVGAIEQYDNDMYSFVQRVKGIPIDKSEDSGITLFLQKNLKILMKVHSSRKFMLPLIN
ncbi:hypothetical protein A8F95_14970 [Bacillus wudalianchiensis]|uniref:Uncharacterized protein n=1 Tax=Pseudobacillus wudalianchiensis TaxID=1743143 RepID=A0A1B9ADU3_9BACI|nr:hypothetical protein A8F95_14970 [Bacillus wudalianchiensis]